MTDDAGGAVSARGRRRIDRAATEMPVVQGLAARLSRERPPEGVRIDARLPVTAETGVLVRAPVSAGAEVALAARNALSTEHDVAVAALKLAALGLQIDEPTPEQAAYATARDEGTDARDVPAKAEHDDAQGHNHSPRSARRPVADRHDSGNGRRDSAARGGTTRFGGRVLAGIGRRHHRLRRWPPTGGSHRPSRRHRTKRL